MTQNPTRLPVRLAVRTEGEWINAYLALSDTMQGAVKLGSIARAIAENHEDIWLAWKALMTKCVAKAVKEIFNQEPEMIEERAPEHERSGRA